MRRASYLKATAGNPVDGSPGTTGAPENETPAAPTPTPAAEHAPKGYIKKNSSSNRLLNLAVVDPTHRPSFE